MYAGIDIAVAVVGLAVLAAFAVRLWRQVKELGRTVSAAAERVGAAQVALEEISREARPKRQIDVHSL